MKQAKKMLCMLLVMLLAFSTVSIGVSAAYTSYASPTSYDIHETPVLSTAQRGSQLLDFVDAMLYDMRDDLYIDITIMKLDFTSVDLKVLLTLSVVTSATLTSMLSAQQEEVLQVRQTLTFSMSFFISSMLTEVS